MPPIEGAAGDAGTKDTVALGAAGAGDDAAKAAAAEAEKATADAAKAEADKTEAQKNMTAEQKVADDKAREDAAKATKDAKDKGDKDKAGAPEKYEDFKPPEGIQFDPEIVTEAQGVFKELGLSQEKAQKLVDLQGKMMTKAASAQTKVWDDLTGGWAKSLLVDKEFGGVKYEENRATANKVIAKFGGKETPALVEALTTTKMGDHPELFRLLFRIGTAMSEDKLSGEGNKDGTGPAAKPLAERMFKDQNPG